MTDHDAVAPAVHAAPLEGAAPAGSTNTADASTLSSKKLELADLHAQLVQLREDNDNLRAALITSREIGAATGMLMAQHRLTQEQAFELLRHVSQNSHRKLRELATELLHSQQPPQLRTPPADPPPTSSA